MKDLTRLASTSNQKDCRINLKSTETEYLIALIGKDTNGMQVIRAGLIKKLLVIQARQAVNGDSGYDELFTEAEKFKPVASLLGQNPDEAKVEKLMQDAMTGVYVSEEDKQWYKQKFGWDLL